MSKYREGQKVFAYVVMSSEGPNILEDGSQPEGMVLIGKQGRGPHHTYEWLNYGELPMTYWHCTKAGRGFIRGEKVEWDDDTKQKIADLKHQAAADRL